MLTALLLAVGVSAAEEESPVTYTPSAASAEPGGTFDVEVAFHGVEGALGYAVMLDNEVFENSVVSLSGEHPVEAAETKAPLFAPAPDDANDVAAAYLEATTLDGTYVTYTFAVAADAVKGSVISLEFKTVVLDVDNEEITGSGTAVVQVTVSDKDSSVNVSVTGKGDNTPNYKVEEGVLTVTYSYACKVGYLNSDGGYTAIPATKNADKTYSYTLPDGVSDIVIVVKGDVNGDGLVNSADTTIINRSLLQKTHPAALDLEALPSFGADINGDGKINSADTTLISRSLLQSSHAAYFAIVP